MKTVVVDASVWIAAVDHRDAAQASSEACLAAIARQHIRIAVPTIARIEVACALTRRFRSAEEARALANAFFDARFVHEEAIDAALASRALLLGTSARLRGADALYAAIAEREAASLITLDRELLARGGGVTPEQWMAPAA